MRIKSIITTGSKYLGQATGTAGVEVYDSFLHNGFIEIEEPPGDISVIINITEIGKQFCSDIHLNLTRKPNSRQLVCRPCLDWSVRRYHLAGTLGASIINYCYKQNLAKRIEGTRVVKFTYNGEKKFRDVFLLDAKPTKSVSISPTL